jgi:hypothetical protein
MNTGWSRARDEGVNAPTTLADIIHDRTAIKVRIAAC